jgi:hypothetical protein
MGNTSLFGLYRHYRTVSRYPRLRALRRALWAWL